ncbi:tRNA A64-2'-O-ribosylphosphate transferase [Powellomyces hirtus]|nr:tRNA A64-2'-O-ribosylphosphate transferase [Powellomyces hirtus]
MSKQDRESIRKEGRNIYNRLRSIAEDALFVEKVAAQFPSLPVIANQRCGSWYIDPAKAFKHSVYFKSTDGHFGKWDFNLRRLNYHIISAICQNKGCIIVDSTRNGKRIPDSLSKTVPIWCAVINTAVAILRRQSATATPESWDIRFHSIPSAVSKSEAQQISDRVLSFAHKLLTSSVDMDKVSRILLKPLRPIWISPASTLDGSFDWASGDDLPFYPVVLLSASMAVPDGLDRREGYTYVQGSADDHEMWAEGLTPELFWQRSAELLATLNPTACTTLVHQIVATSASRVSTSGSSSTATSSSIGTTGISIGNHASGRPPTCFADHDLVINCGAPEHVFPDKEAMILANRYLFLPISEGKKGQHQLFDSLGPVLAYIREPLREGKRVLIHCMQGKDRSVGIALAILVRYMDDEGVLHVDWDTPSEITKDKIQNRLLYIQSFRHVASPTRATLQKVKTYFMSGGYAGQ